MVLSGVNVLADNGNGVDSDPDGDSLSVSLVSDVTNGALVLNPDGSFTYTPIDKASPLASRKTGMHRGIIDLNRSRYRGPKTVANIKTLRT